MNNAIVKACAGALVALMGCLASAEELDLSGVWTLTQAETNTVSCPVAVPGGIYTALYEAKFIPDPYFGQNEKKTQWPSRVEWDFERTFEAGADLVGRKSVTLRLEDVDCFADIYLNGAKVGETFNRFRRWDFDVKRHLKPGRNTIRVRFRSTEKISYAEADKYPKGRFPLDRATTVQHINLVRTVQCHGGWNWGITQMDTGLMGTVKLIAEDDFRVDYVYTEQKFADDLSRCDVTVFAEIVNADGTRETVKDVVRVDRPKLWWPNDVGEQNLTDVSFAVKGRRMTKRIGLRKLEVVNDMDERPDPVDGKAGRQMTVVVNGRRIFMKGADWIPCDAFENRQRGWYRQYLEDMRTSHMNMVRVWGGGQFEHPEFYDLCDELGILIWHDFMFSCATYPGTKEFLDNVAEEVRHQVKNLRDHASIALWCGDNECIGAAGWYGARRKPEIYRENLRLCAERAKFLDAICREVDPTRTFWPSSPCLGPGNFGDGWKDDSSGDMHFWDLWNGAPFARSREIRPRFCSEFGFQSYPSAETALTFVTPDQLDPRAPDFAYHQKFRGGHRTIRRAMDRYFSPPKDAKSLIYLSQVQQAVAIKMSVEHLRSIMPRCMGAIYWQLNDNWPVASWSSIEYGGKWKHLQYHAKRFYAPCALTVKPAYKDDSTLEFWAMNDKDEPLDGEAKIECWTMDGTVEKTLSYALDVPARSAKKLASVPTASFGDRARRRRTFLALSGTECPDSEYAFDSFRVTSFAEAKVGFRAEEKDGRWQVTLSTDKPAFFVWVDAPGVKGVFSDDSFTLLPGRPKTVTFTKRPYEKATFADFQRALEVTHLRESYTENR